MATSLPAAVKDQCEKLLRTTVSAVFPVRGGDISVARRLETNRGTFFLKMNEAPQAHALFAAEAAGLELLARAYALRLPAVQGHSTAEHGPVGWLLLEYIESGPRSADFWSRFGESIATLHRTRHAQFGLATDNFIGSLPQSNRPHSQWCTFYIEERLLPQIRLAETQAHFSTADHQLFEQLFVQLPTLLPDEPPALIHGDLWSGNFLSDEHGAPVLIDPAVCFASREMDLAMTRLFGGFDPLFYQAYQQAFPLLPGHEERQDLYQLYYLLVHVNLFGGGYVQSVRQILRRFR
ncbi:MAG TPA: fructosamine kinase family protein [Saprospiraceae bacterium]|nr:fructosamine kinase family protein [Saprospiraceae bacterium]HMP25578.1 fructosamine kinase family protein [Saprospiraceae bacterium]